MKNSYNIFAPGSVITRSRDLRGQLITAIVLKRNVIVIDITSSRIVGQVGFLAHVFDCFSRARISVDVVATSEGI